MFARAWLIRNLAQGGGSFDAYVDPKHRRQGIAQGLMQHFAAYAATKGASEAFLEVAEDNNAAIALYHRFSFTKVGLRKAYYATPKGPHISALVMRKSL